MFRKRKASSNLDEASRLRPFENHRNEPPAEEPEDADMRLPDGEAPGTNSTSNLSNQPLHSAVHHSNPQSSLQLASTNPGAQRSSWPGLGALKKALDEASSAFEPLKSAVSGLQWCIHTLDTEAKTHKGYNNIKSTLDVLLQDLSTYVGGTAPPVMTPAITALSQGLKREMERVDEEQNKRKLSRLAKADEDLDQLMECYDRIRMLLERLKLNANLSTWKIVDEHVAETRLKGLPHSPAAMYRSSVSENLGRSRCTENTRVSVLHQLHEWSRNIASEKIFWVNGMAGTGKTTIAYSLCEWLENNHKLAASFFCSRQLPECRDVNRIVPTIAYQLARFSRPFYHETAEILATDADAHNQTMDKQLKQLLVDLLSRIKHTLPTDLVIVVDALDECTDDTGVAKFLSTLLLGARDLPMKIFVTSRPNPSILELMRKQQHKGARVEMRLHELDRATVRDDIKMYLHVQLNGHLLLFHNKMARRLRFDQINTYSFGLAPHAVLVLGIPLTSPQYQKCVWGEPETLDSLVKRSGALFIYAATVVRYIGMNDFVCGQELLEEIIGSQASGNQSSESSKEIDGLYSSILKPILSGSNVHRIVRERITTILHTVICTREPLSLSVMAKLLGLDGPNAVHKALQPLLSVLQISSSDSTITTLHESFPNYLLDKSRSNEFHCDEGTHNDYLAELCFKQIKAVDPPFNICGLESSYVFDRDVPDMNARIKRCISDELFYACQYWASHFRIARHSGKLCVSLFEFLSKRLLLWLEVMNLKGLGPDAVGMLHDIQRLSQDAIHVKCGNTELSRDAWRFAATFVSSPAALSTPHMYVSTLSFWPEEACISMHYTQSRHVSLKGSSAMRVRRPVPVSTYQTAAMLTSINYSPDGSQIVSAEKDGMVIIRNAHSGKIIGQPLQGHTNLVTSVACSPDGAYIVSGSWDKTIRIWDAKTGRVVGQPLQGHTDHVSSVAYSHDGAYIVSASWDNTIRMWDAKTGRVVGQPLKDYTGGVNSVACSPDCAYIVSASWDKTIRIWDAKTGRVIGQPLQGHTDHVSSVAYSPNGAYIVSGSWDRTIRVWDAETGRVIGQPLRGHTDDVTSVACSPDGAYIVSGSSDTTIRLWDPKTGQVVGQPLQGHTNGVTSVAYSPDGAYIASGSDDKTIRMWNPRTGRVIDQPLPGHTDGVISVAYSPNGAYIASGSSDKTIRLWDVTIGQVVGQPLQGHTEGVISVACSPDCAYIVSASWDNTIRLWDAKTGQVVGQPLQGHTDGVSSVAYSPNGAYIVSGSWDRTIRVWDAETGRVIGQPLRGHTDGVTSVAYSPDGAYIVSGSSDTTIRLWDAQTGRVVGQPLWGHTDHVSSVAYSPNGAYIVSGSYDKTIRMWDAKTRRVVGQPRQGHTAWVTSVAYSPNGAYIVSGSDDKTIRIWEANSGRVVGQPLQGHTKGVNSVAYSPDGAYTVSGSGDETTRMWDVNAGRVIGESLYGHNRWVTSAAYLPDGAHIVSSSCDKTLCVWKQPGDQNPFDTCGSASSAPRTRIYHMPQNQSTDYHICSSDCRLDGTHHPWVLDEDGWVVPNGGEPLVWVPPDLRVVLMRPRNTLLCSSRFGVLKLRFDHLRIGKHWKDIF
ncbi:WD repeat-containing protein [Ceratobasidium sp. AG-Ba]|nr:WD repeat-containing protein [Ceratobasidium sp. AG-Ba]